jgi:hypothetical protein
MYFCKFPVCPVLFIYFPDNKVVDNKELTPKPSPIFQLYLVCPLYCFALLPFHLPSKTTIEGQTSSQPVVNESFSDHQ